MFDSKTVRGGPEDMDLDLDEALAEEEEPKSYDEFKKGRSVRQVRNQNLFELIKGNLEFRCGFINVRLFV